MKKKSGNLPNDIGILNTNVLAYMYTDYKGIYLKIAKNTHT